MIFIPLFYILGGVLVVVGASCPSLVPRSEWGARPSRTPVGAVTQTPVPYVIVHHTATPPCTTAEQCEARLRSVQQEHQGAARGFADIGYNFLIGGDGNIYEGRSWGKTGAHAPNYNSRSIGISMIGNFSAESPPSNMMQLLRNLIACGVQTGKILEHYKLLGHRQVRQTICPGDKLYQEIKKWPNWVAQPV